MYRRYLDYLHGSRLQNLNVTWQFIEKMKKAMPTRPQSSGDVEAVETASTEAAAAAADAKAKKTKPSKAPLANEVDATKARFLREINYNEMQRSMMRAYFQVRTLSVGWTVRAVSGLSLSVGADNVSWVCLQLFNALEREGHVPTVVPKFSSALIRFEHRFAAFRSIHFPAALTHEDFAQNSDFSPYDVALIYKSADECFKVARAHGEVLLHSDDMNGAVSSSRNSSASGRQRVIHGAEVEALMKAAIANSVALIRREQQTVAVASSATAGGRAKKSGKSGSADAASLSLAAAKAPELLNFSTHPHFPVVSFPDKKA